MKLKFLFLLLCAFVASTWAAGPTAPGAAAGNQPPDRIPAANQALTVQDVSPPIPIVKDVVDSVVKEQQALILTPEQIEAIKKTTAKARETEAFQYPNKFIAKPVARSFYIEPDSTQQPRMVRLSMGTITSLVFSDINGNPWYVASASFDCALFDDGKACGRGAGAQPATPTNTIKLQPIRPYAYGNIVVELEGLPGPVIFMLSTGQSDENDVRIDARVSGRNPNAKPQAIAMDRMPEHDSVMGYILDGVTPQGAQRLKVTGGQADGWILNGALYVRTRLSVLSPAFTNHVGSADGMHVYKFFSVIPNLLVSANGKTTTLFVSGY